MSRTEEEIKKFDKRPWWRQHLHFPKKDWTIVCDSNPILRETGIYQEERIKNCKFRPLIKEPQKIADVDITELLHHERECGIVTYLLNKWEKKNPSMYILLKVAKEGEKCETKKLKR